MKRLLTILALVALISTPAAAQAAPVPDQGPSVSQGVDWGPDHLVDCEVYPGKVYDIYIQGRKVRTNGTGKCVPSKPDYDRSILYIMRHEGFGWTVYASSTLVNPDASWFQTTTAPKCEPDVYMATMKFYGTEDGDGIVFEHNGPAVYIDCQ